MTKQRDKKKSGESEVEMLAKHQSRVGHPVGSGPAEEPAPGGSHKMKRKEYEHELRHLHGEARCRTGVGEGLWGEDMHCLRGPRHGRQGRDDQGHHRAGEPQSLPSRRPPCTHCSGEVTDVHPTIRAPFPGCRCGDDLRPQLVQPGGGRAGDGLLHPRRVRSLPGVDAQRGKGHGGFGILLIKYWLEVSPDEQTRRLQSRIDDPRKIWKLSELDLLSYRRWFDYSRARDECSPPPILPGRPGGS